MAASNGKIVVITGVSRGLGRAMVDEFVRLGHTVTGCARSKKEVEALGATYKRPHLFESVDVSDDRAVTQWAAKVIDAIGPPDLLINNAALINRNAALWQVGRTVVEDNIIELVLTPTAYGAPLAIDIYDSLSGLHGSQRVYQQIWVLQGIMEITLDKQCHQLRQGDCLAMELNQPTMFRNLTRKPARYAVG